MIKILRSLYTFYLNHFFVGFGISCSCMYMYWVLGNDAIPMLCWFKAITMGIFFYYISKNKSKEFFYFQNLGISKKLLWGATLGADFVIFVLGMIIAHKFI